MINTVTVMRDAQIGRENTGMHAPARRSCAAQTGPRSNGFRLRCRLRARNRRMDASPTTRWCLVVVSMVYLIRSNRADARRSFDAEVRSAASRSPEVTSESPVTATVSAEAVGLRINRLPEHLMMYVGLGPLNHATRNFKSFVWTC